jgi:signal peptidase II
MKNLWRQILICVTIIFCDQVSKALIQQHFVLGESFPIISNFFSLTYVLNPGAAFGMGAQAAPWIRVLFFLFVPTLAVLWLMVLIWKERHRSAFLGLTYTLILSGAIGNLIDRYLYGEVVDFLLFYWRQYHFPAFNIADSSITIAAFCLFYDMIRQGREKAPPS